MEEMGDEQASSREKEEEQAFLVNLYKFMKDRHTPIERVPHLGFKQSASIYLARVHSFLLSQLTAQLLITVSWGGGENSRSLCWFPAQVALQEWV